MTLVSIGLRSAYGILALLYIILLPIHEVVGHCRCRNETCYNGCNCYDVDRSFAQKCDGGYTYKCNGSSIDSFPDIFPTRDASNKLCVFELSHTVITRLENRSFLKMGENKQDLQIVNLADNHIAIIDAEAFYGLANLLALNLASNNITLESFVEGTFRHLKQLEKISLKNNLFTTFDGLDIMLSQLPNLQSIYIDGCTGCEFGPGMEFLTKLRYISLSGRESRKCDLSEMSATMFQHVPNITHLYVSSCNLSNNVNNITFQHLKKLKFLDISYNENLKFEGMNRCLYGLRNSTTLKELNVNHIHESYERGTILKMEHVENMKTLKNLATLHMDLNKLEVLEPGILAQGMIPESLSMVTLTGNRLTYGTYVNHMFMAGHIRHLEISRQHLYFDPFLHSHTENDDAPTLNGKCLDFLALDDDQDVPTTNHKDVSIPQYTNDHRVANNIIDNCYDREDVFIIPKELETWRWRMSFLYFDVPNITLAHALNTSVYIPQCMIGSPNLHTLDLSFNLIHSWQGPVFGVSNIRNISLADNNCKNVSLFFFDHFTGLKALNVSGNYLGYVLHPRNIGSYETFKTLSNLETLDMSNNKIFRLDSKIFHNLTKLRKLNMGVNMMEDWTPTLENSPCLHELDLSMNKFSTIPKSLRNHLDRVAQTQKTQCNISGNVTLNMAGNPIECRCDSIQLMKWMVKSKVVVTFRQEDTCHLPGGARRFLEHEHVMAEIIEILERDCVSYTTFTVISVVIFTCFATVVVGIFAYRHRWRLRHWYYSQSRRHNHRGFERIFENDAFISYSESDSTFIKNKLIPALEDSHSLNVWVADRDSQPGANIATNVTHAIYSSKKSVLLISRKYISEKWCDYEMNMARIESIESKRRLMILVLFDDIPAKQMPIDIMRLLQSEVSLEYPTHPQDVDDFWSRLADAIASE